MPGFFSNSTGLSIFTVDKPGSVTAEKLKRFAFRPIDDSSETESIGWTNIDDMTDFDWRLSPPEKGEFLYFSLRVDKRKIQSAVLKRFLQEAVNAELEKIHAEGREFISRQRKKELKELHTQRLLSRAVPVPSVTEAALDTSNGTLYVASTSSSTIAALVELMGRSFGVECVPLASSLNIAQDDVARYLARLYEEGVSVDDFRLEHAGQVHLGQGTETEVTVKNEPDSVQSGLAAGLTIRKLKIRMSENGDANEWEFTLNSDLTLSGLKTPHVDKPADGDGDAVILEKLYLIGKVKDALAGLLTGR